LIGYGGEGGDEREIHGFNVIIMTKESPEFCAYPSVFFLGIL
jgi:hypothetical protein